MSTGNIKSLRKKKIKMHSFIIFMLIFKVREARTEKWTVKIRQKIKKIVNQSPRQILSPSVIFILQVADLAVNCIPSKSSYYSNQLFIIKRKWVWKIHSDVQVIWPLNFISLLNMKTSCVLSALCCSSLDGTSVHLSWREMIQRLFQNGDKIKEEYGAEECTFFLPVNLKKITQTSRKISERTHLKRKYWVIGV